MRLLAIITHDFEYSVKKGQTDSLKSLLNPDDVFESVEVLGTYGKELFKYRRVKLADNIYLTSFGNSKLWLPFYLIAGLVIALRNKIDIIYVLNAHYPLSFTALIFQALLRIPACIAVNNDHEKEAILENKPGLAHFIKKIESFVIPRCRYWLAHNDCYKYLMIRRGANLKKFKQRYWFGYNVTYFLDAPRCPDEKAFTILFCGRLNPQKDPMTLLSAYELASEKIKNLKLVIAGEGPMRPAMENFIKGHGLKNITFRGLLDRDGLKDAMSKSDIFVLPTRYEGYSNVLQEAEAARVPIITTDIVYNKDIVSKDDCLLFKETDVFGLADRILEYYTSPYLRKSMAQKGYARIKHFFFDINPLKVNGQTFKEIYNETRNRK